MPTPSSISAYFDGQDTQANKTVQYRPYDLKRPWIYDSNMKHVDELTFRPIDADNLDFIFVHQLLIRLSESSKHGDNVLQLSLEIKLP